MMVILLFVVFTMMIIISRIGSSTSPTGQFRPTFFLMMSLFPNCRQTGSRLRLATRLDCSVRACLAPPA